MKWDLAIFDLDGTLLNTIADLGAAVDHSLAEAGFPGHTSAEYRRMVGHGIRNLIKNALPQEASTDDRLVDERLASFVDYYIAHIDDKTRPYAGIPGLLRRLAACGTQIAVASNKFQAGTDRLIAGFFPDISFCAVLGNREGLPLKPDPEVVFLCRRASGLAEDAKIAMVGDSPTDMRTAAAAGAAGIGVTWGFRDECEIAAAGADYMARDAAELESILI